jgi:hypothetical protein
VLAHAPQQEIDAVLAEERLAGEDHRRHAPVAGRFELALVRLDDRVVAGGSAVTAASIAARSSPARAAASARCAPSCQPVTFPFQMICDTSSMNGRPRPRSTASTPSRVRRWMYGCSAATSRVAKSCTIGSGRGQP